MAIVAILGGLAVLVVIALAGLGLMVVLEPEPDERYSPTDDTAWAVANCPEPPTDGVGIPDAIRRRPWWRP